LGREPCGPGALKCPGAIEAKVVDHGVEIAALIAPKERGVMRRLEPRLEAVRQRDASRGGPGAQQLVGGGAGPAGSLLPRGGVGQPPAIELKDLPSRLGDGQSYGIDKRIEGSAEIPQLLGPGGAGQHRSQNDHHH
jgi:hypothetical protein